jgi:multiple sugar transport system permease protein
MMNKISLGPNRFQNTAFLLLLPALLVIIFILIYPITYGIFMSFTNRFFSYDNYSFIGLNNYGIILQDPLFMKALVNSTKLAFYTIFFNSLIGFGLAILLNSVENYTKFFRIMFFLPWILPSTVVAFAFRWLYNDNYGYFNYLLVKWHYIDTAVNPLAQSNLVWAGIVIPAVWFSYPFVMLVFAAALKSISPNIYEAAQIDGASRWQTFTAITLPALKSTFVMVTILQVIWEFSSFDLVYLLTRGGPGNATLTLSLYIYKLAFEYKKIGYACAVATALFLMLAVLIVLCFEIYKYGDKDED